MIWTTETIVGFVIACCLTIVVVIAIAMTITYINIFMSWYRYDQSRAKFRNTDRKFN